MAWFQVSSGRLRFRGRITRKPFLDWTTTREGQTAVDAVAKDLRFCLFGRVRTARRRMWRDLRSTVTTESMRTTLQAASEHYAAASTELAYAPSLPRVTVALHRLVVVPRTMIAARATSALTARLMMLSPFAALDEALRAFLCHRLVWEMDDAVRRAKPSARRPVHARESWACVGVDDRFVWIDPLWSGRDWRGHVVMFEMPSDAPSRRERHEIEAAIERLQNSLPAMSTVQRDGTVRSASAAMTPARI